MIPRKHVTLIALGACLVGLSVLGSAKNPVERPIKMSIHETLVVSLTDGSWEVSGTGNCSQLGPIENRGGGGSILDGSPYGSGVTTAANGDELFWSSPDGVTTTIYGGTGRFASATGSLTATSVELVPWTVSPTGTLVFDAVICNEGTITY